MKTEPLRRDNNCYDCSGINRNVCDSVSALSSFVSFLLDMKWKQPTVNADRTLTVEYPFFLTAEVLHVEDLELYALMIFLVFVAAWVCSCSTYVQASM